MGTKAFYNISAISVMYVARIRISDYIQRKEEKLTGFVKTMSYLYCPYDWWAGEGGKLDHKSGSC